MDISQTVAGSELSLVSSESASKLVLIIRLIEFKKTVVAGFQDLELFQVMKVSKKQGKRLSPKVKQLAISENII